MDKVGQQLKAIWDDLGLNQRVSLGLSALAIIVGMAALIVWSSRADFRLLYGGLDDSEISKVVAELGAAGITHELGPDGRSVRVPADQVHSARLHLATKNLPGDSEVGWEIFDKPNFGISDFIQRAHYLRAVQGELARTISQMDEVESAKVHITKPKNRLLARTSEPSKASVMIKARGQLDDSAINAIRYMVANAVEGLAPNYVTVADTRGRTLSENSPEESMLGMTSGQLKARSKMETYFADKAEDMLETVLGPGRAIVRVTADIDFETVTQTAEVYDPEAKVERSSTVNDETLDSTTSDLEGASPGVNANTTSNTNSAAGSGSVRNDSRKITQTEYDVSRTISNTVKNAGGIRSLSAAVFVAANTIVTNGVREVVPRSQEELAKLQRIVEGALGIPDAQQGDTKNRVIVEEMPFNDTTDPAMVSELVMQERIQLGLSLVREFGYPAMGLLLLWMFWRKMKQTADIEIPIGAKVGDIEQAANSSEKKSDEDEDEELQPGVLSVDAVNRIVQENPENLTEAIRSWLNEDQAAKN